MSIESQSRERAEPADGSVEFGHAVSGRDDLRIVVGGIAAGMAIIFLVLYFFPPPVSLQKFDPQNEQTAGR